MSIGVCATYEFSKIDPDREVKWCNTETGECDLRQTPVTLKKDVTFCINPFEGFEHLYRPAVMAEALEVISRKYKKDGEWECMARIVDYTSQGGNFRHVKRNDVCVSPANVFLSEDSSQVFLKCYSTASEQKDAGMQGFGVILSGTLFWAYCEQQ